MYPQFITSCGYFSVFYSFNNQSYLIYAIGIVEIYFPAFTLRIHKAQKAFCSGNSAEFVYYILKVDTC